MTKKSIALPAAALTEDWENTEWFCPSCAAQEVWRLVVATPTSVPKHMCAAEKCGARFQLSAAIEKDETEASVARVQALSSESSAAEARTDERAAVKASQ